MSHIRIHDDVKEELRDTLSPGVLAVLEKFKWHLFVQDGMDEHDGYEHMRRGLCILCGEKLGEDALILVDDDGIEGLWCGPNCLTDMHNIVFLERLLSDLTERLDPNNQEDT